MSALDLSRLSGSDAAVALRSYPRRYRAAMQPIDGDPDVEELSPRVGPAGRSALDFVCETTSPCASTPAAIHQILVHDEAELLPEVFDRLARDRLTRERPVTADHGAQIALAALDEATKTLSEAIESISGADWSRPAVTADGKRVTTLDVVREAVRTGAENLRCIDETLSAVRR